MSEEDADLRRRIDEMSVTIRNVQAMVLQMRREMDQEKRKASSSPDCKSTEYYLQMLRNGCQTYEQWLDRSLDAVRKLAGDTESLVVSESPIRRPRRAKPRIDPTDIPQDFPLINKPSRKNDGTFYIADTQSTLNFPTRETLDGLTASKLSTPASQQSVELSSVSHDNSEVPTSAVSSEAVSSSAIGTDSIEASAENVTQVEMSVDDHEQVGVEASDESSSSEIDENALSQMLPQSGFVFGHANTPKQGGHLDQSANPYAQLNSISRLPRL